MREVGIILPVYNQAEFLPAQLDALVNQTFKDWLCIIVDDGSTDTTRTVAAAYAIEFPDRFRFVSMPQNGGTADAINLGWNFLPSTRWRTWVSADNEQHAEWLERLLEVGHRPSVGAVFSAYDRVENGRVTPSFSPKRGDTEDPGQYKLGQLVNTLNCFFGPSFIIRTPVWRRAGLHRGRISHDYDHWLRVEEVCMGRQLSIEYVATPLCRYNAHDQRVTVTRSHEFDAHQWRVEAIKRRGLQVVPK